MVSEPHHAGEAIALVDGERSLTYTELNDAVAVLLLAC